MSIQSPKSIPKALFIPRSDLIELSTPLASSHLDMDMDLTMAPQKKTRSDEYYVDLLSGDATHQSRPTSPLIADRYLDVHQRVEKGKQQIYQEEKSQYDDHSDGSHSAHVNITFTNNRFR